MPEVTIGVPVYNGEDLIAECLECLVNQTFSDIEILVFDNASTDRTQEIVEGFAARDQRIRYVRRPETIPVLKNYVEPLNLASTPYFLWRAHDDLSSLDYVEKLLAAMKAKPNARLAVGTIEHVRRHGKPTRVVTPTLPQTTVKAIEIVQLMFRSHAGWFYGLWETAELRKIIGRVWTEFPHAWASDHLVLYPVLLDRAVAAAPETRFIQRLVEKAYTPKKGSKPAPSLMYSRRKSFLRSCNRFLAERPFALATRMVVRIATWPYVGKRTYRLTTLIRQYILDVMAMRGKPSDKSREEYL